jgi:hypothetical protein
LNYRLSAESLLELIGHLSDPLAVVDTEYYDVAANSGAKVIDSDEFLATARIAEPVSLFADPDVAGMSVTRRRRGRTLQPS